MLRFAAGVALVLLGLSASSLARQDETLQELVARAEASTADKQPPLYMEAAERQRVAAVAAMKGEQWKVFFADLQDVVKFCDRAQAAAIGSNKRLKETEIKIRRIATALKETKMDVGVDDQAAVQAAIDALERFRTELMSKMFAPKKR